MRKAEFIKKIEGGINSFKQEVEKNDGSTLATIGNTIRSAFDSLVETISSNKNAQKATETVKKHLGDLEDAIIKGDKKISSSAMNAMQKAFNGLKDKIHEEDSTDVKATVEYTPNKSKVFTVGKHQDVPVAKPNKKSTAKADAKAVAKPKAATKKAPAKKTTASTSKKAAPSTEAKVTKKAVAPKPKAAKPKTTETKD